MGQIYVFDLKGYLGPKSKGSGFLLHDIVECYLLSYQVWKSTGAGL